ncbi:copper resistance protein B [Undibacterium sp. FT79W]|uniref:copper resistance protein B n=1 Tax=Undibacterium sp. FT79W TaxID=2762296 RepID=UPI00164CDA08|nr:copper resistance protein B [Undibacterium sp. FT79W]
MAGAGATEFSGVPAYNPYIGVAWTRKLGNTADLSRRAGEYVSERQVVAGVRIWF